MGAPLANNFKPVLPRRVYFVARESIDRTGIMVLLSRGSAELLSNWDNGTRTATGVNAFFHHEDYCLVMVFA
jgi:hypothetical protein